MSAKKTKATKPAAKKAAKPKKATKPAAKKAAKPKKATKPAAKKVEPSATAPSAPRKTGFDVPAIRALLRRADRIVHGELAQPLFDQWAQAAIHALGSAGPFPRELSEAFDVQPAGGGRGARITRLRLCVNVLRGALE